MATTGFWAVKANLLALIKYAENPEKTSVFGEKELKSLHDVLDYDMNGDKTEQKLYVTGINCLPETVYERMMATKRQFNKTGGVLAYHAYQSFKEGEVTPQECHRIGIEMAKKMWGDRFEVLVTSHVNGHHLHNHYCINSVSFVDGKKFENKIAEHMRMREISDEICKKHRLSVLRGSHFYAKQSKREYWKNKSASEIEKEIIRQDIWEAAYHAKEPNEFYRQLRKSLNLSQAKVAVMAGTQQTSINRYESNQYDPPLNILIWYADYFDVSLDYLCGRTDKPQGKLYEYEPKALKIKEENKADMEQFIDMCFDPSSPAGVKMKEAMMKLLIEKEDK